MLSTSYKLASYSCQLLSNDRNEGVNNRRVTCIKHRSLLTTSYDVFDEQTEVIIYIIYSLPASLSESGFSNQLPFEDANYVDLAIHV